MEYGGLDEKTCGTKISPDIRKNVTEEHKPPIGKKSVRNNFLLRKVSRCNVGAVLRLAAQ